MLRVNAVMRRACISTTLDETRWLSCFTSIIIRVCVGGGQCTDGRLIVQCYLGTFCSQRYRGIESNLFGFN